MARLEGVLTLVNDSGPWFRIQGKHIREESAKPIGFRLSLDKSSGITADLHLGTGLWIRAGWYPAHGRCATEYHATWGAHRCWARYLVSRVYQYGVA